MAIPNGLASLFHESEVSTLDTRTVADLSLGTSMPTAFWPGIGASILIVCAPRSRAMLLSRAVILLNLTPDGGLSVYWVTRGPILASAISTSILKLASVSLIVLALASTSPGSALSCF